MRNSVAWVAGAALSFAFAPPASAGVILLLTDDGSGGVETGMIVAGRNPFPYPSYNAAFFANVGNFTTAGVSAQLIPPTYFTRDGANSRDIAITTIALADSGAQDSVTLGFDFPMPANDIRYFGNSEGMSPVPGLAFSSLLPGLYTAPGVGLDPLTLWIRDPVNPTPVVACTGICTLGPAVAAGALGVGPGGVVIADGGAVSAPNGVLAGFGVDAAANGPNSGIVYVSAGRIDAGGGSSSAVLVGAVGGFGEMQVADGSVVTVSSNATGEAGLFVGWLGSTGFLDVESGSTILLRDTTGAAGAGGGLLIGTNSATTAGLGDVTVEGSGSAIIIDNPSGGIAAVNVGFSAGSAVGTATGVLEVDDGGRIEVRSPQTFASLGIGLGGGSSNGYVEVTDGGEIEIEGAAAGLFVSTDNGTTLNQNTSVGQLSISDGGRVSVTATAVPAIALIGHGLGLGIVEIDTGGALEVQGDIRVSANNDVQTLYQSGTGNSQQRGILIVNGTGSATATGTTYIGNGTSAAINGSLFGTGIVHSDTVVQLGGLLAAGESPGTLTIDGDLTFTGGWLDVEVAGTAGGLFDVVNVLGTADLTGANIRFSFLDGFLPTMGDAFSFFVAGATLGLASAQLSYEGAAPGFQFDILQNGGALSFLALNNAAPPVPLPGALLLLTSGLAGMLGIGARRRRTTAANATAEHAIG